MTGCDGPYVVRIRAKAHTGYAAVEYTLHAGGRDALPNGHHAGVRHGALWRLHNGGLYQREQCNEHETVRKKR